MPDEPTAEAVGSRRVPIELESGEMKMTKSIKITMDIPIARRMLKVAGFDLTEIDSATDDEIFGKVLSLIDCYGASFVSGEQEDLSHVMMIDMVRELGPYKMDEVVLFNINHISEDDALRHVRSGLYSRDVLVMPKKQWISLFRDGKAD